MSIFTQEHDAKSRLLQNLKDALQALEDGRLELLQEVIVNSSADANGYCRHKDSMFFGFEFRMAPKKAERKSEAPVWVPPPGPVPGPTPKVGATLPAEPARPALEMPEGLKMTSGMATRCKQSDGKYHCPKGCGFTTESDTGLKKHYNRCDRKPRITL